MCTRTPAYTCVSLCAYTHEHTCMEVRQQLSGVGAFLPPCEFQGSNSGDQACGKCLYLVTFLKHQCLTNQQFQSTLVYWPYLLIPRGKHGHHGNTVRCWSLGSRREPSKAGAFLWSLSMSQAFPVPSARLLQSFSFRLKTCVPTGKTYLSYSFSPMP